MRSRPHLPKTEYEFHKVPQSERAACLTYEIARERAVLKREKLFWEAADVDCHVRDRVEAEQAKQELQGQLYALKAYRVAWPLLTRAEKQRHAARDQKSLREPVKLLSETEAIERVFLRHSSSRERLEVLIDWSTPDSTLKKSFERMVKRQRSTPSSKASQTPQKKSSGRRTSVDEKLFQLAAYRCFRAGYSLKEACNVLSLARVSLTRIASSTVSHKLRHVAAQGQALIFGEL